jgi:hypothetical protein
MFFVHDEVSCALLLGFVLRQFEDSTRVAKLSVVRVSSHDVIPKLGGWRIEKCLLKQCSDDKLADV